MVTLKCYICGKTFLAKDNTQFLCSDECKKIHIDYCSQVYSEIFHQYVNPKWKKKCIVCGNEFLAKVPHQLSCSPECARQRERLKERDRLRKRRC